ncbi:MAG TPA: sigma-70 family RNA polymerase sigma factor [Candidatus Limnocylindrales bacterium]|nr:sigma-70 family RNA polymerase sigma factor [Candidatus Limnocylindrales bacterium]
MIPIGPVTANVATLDEGDALPPTLVTVEASANETFEAIYEAHFRAVYRYALLATRRSADAEDVVSDTFARALSAWTRGNGPAGRPLPWLLVICRRIVTDRWRRQRLIGWLPMVRSGAVGSEDQAEASLDPGADDEEFRAREFWLWLDSVTRVLPRRQREVLFLRYERDLDDEDIGSVLGLTPSGVRSLTARAIASLRRHPELLR